MSANPEARESEEPKAPKDEARAAAPEAAATPAPDYLHEEPQVEYVPPPPPPEPEPEPEVSIAPEPEPWRPRVREDTTLKPMVEGEQGAGEFDAVFEGRSEAGLGERLKPTAGYLLMIAAPLTLGVSAVPAALMAYAARDSAPEWLRTHYLFQLRTFWAGLFISIVAGGTYLFFDRGPAWAVASAHVVWGLIWLLTVVWFVLRSAVGLLRLRRGEAFRKYRTWTF